MSEHQTQLKVAATGTTVGAVLDDDLSLDDLFDAEAQWAEPRVRLRQQLRWNAIPDDDWPESLHWDWSRKAARLRDDQLGPFGTVRLCGVRLNDEWQGVLWCETFDMKLGCERVTRLAPAGRSLVYVPFVELAPWNWDVPLVSKAVQRRRYEGIGWQLMMCAVAWSRELGFAGRVGLHALRQAERFYRSSCGMSDLGADPACQCLRYFELDAAGAGKFLE